MLFSVGLIVFRETLEAALFIGIVAAATTHLAQRWRWLILGVVAGAGASVLLAAGMESIAGWANGIGQDLLAAMLLAVALGFLAWHSIHAPYHAQQARLYAQKMGAVTKANAHTMLALTLAVGLAVLREGAETVLFIAGTLQGDHANFNTIAANVAGGMACGALVGCLLYLGLGLIRPKHLFTFTNTLILLLAGALASQLVLTLNQANWLTLLADKAWDLSTILPNQSSLGILLHGLVGYDASPTEAQLLAYIGAVLLIGLATSLAQKRAQHNAALKLRQAIHEATIAQPN